MSEVERKAWPSPLELRAQLAVVVDAAVEDDREAERVVAHRLRAELGEVDDRQPPVHHPGAAVEPDALAVGPARGERRVHALERRPVGRRGHGAARRRSRTRQPSAPRAVARRLDERAEQPRLRALDLVERLGVPLHAEHEPARRRPRSPRPSRRRAHATARRPSPSRSTAWWWNELTDTASAPSGAREPRAGLAPTSCVTAQPGAVRLAVVAAGAGRGCRRAPR